MVSINLLTVFVLACAGSSAALVTPKTDGPAPVMPTLTNKINMKLPAFASVIERGNKKSLYISSFDGNPFAGKGADKVYYFSDASLAASSKATESVATIPGNIVWPNEVVDAPLEIFGKPGVIAAGGFLVPGKSNGGLFFSPLDGNVQGEWTEIFSAKNYFYHRVAFMDVDADGTKEILSCRAQKSTFGSGHGNLVWLKPKDVSNPRGEWTEQVIGPHCDTFFQVVDLNGDGKLDIVSAEFWGSSLTVITSSDPKNRFDDPSKLVYNVIDKDIGRVFDIQVVDLNKDGKSELLVTNHQGGKDRPTGSVYAYEIPADITQKFTRHVLAEKFPVLQGGIGQAAPGAGHAFQPTKTSKDKPLIGLAGDGSQSAYILTPKSQSPTNWEYTTTELHNCHSTVGAIGYGDVNDDGKTELLVPCYDKGYVAVFSY